MRSIWKGSVAFGLVNVPVKLYSATEEKDVRFHQVHAQDGGRIRYKRVCDIDGVVHEGRNTLMDRWKAVYAQKTNARVLADVIGGADIFLGNDFRNYRATFLTITISYRPQLLRPGGRSAL